MTSSGKLRAVSLFQRYRLRGPATGREVVLPAEPDRVYLNQQSDEQLEVVGKLLPLAPSTSDLPWTVENLRLCGCWRDQLVQKDLNDCPYCGKRMEPLTTKS